MTTPLLIYGAGGFAREVAWLAEVCHQHGNRMEPVAYIDDSTETGHAATSLNGYPVLTLEEAVHRFPNAGFVAAIGDPRARKAVSRKALDAGLTEACLVHPRVEMSRFIDIGPGAVICAGNILTTNIVIGEGIQLNLGCTVGHDCVIGDFVTISPGAHISGNVHIHAGAYVGTGAVIINGHPNKPLIIGEGATVGAGCCVVKNVEPGITVVGVPARPVPPKPAPEVVPSPSLEGRRVAAHGS